MKKLAPKPSRFRINIPALSLWRRHGLNLAITSVATAICTLAFTQHQQAERALVDMEHVYHQQQNVNSAGQQAAALIRLYRDAYDQMLARGAIGEAQRLQWIEALSASVNRRSVPQLRFTLAATEPATTANTAYYSDTISLKVTPMRLDFSLLHEGDFYHLMADLRAEAQGIFSAQSCEFRQTEAEILPAVADVVENSLERAGINNLERAGINSLERAGVNSPERKGINSPEQLAVNTPPKLKGECDLVWYSVADLQRHTAL